ncbi:ABC transporter ATP-binding protein [Clostridium sp.]|uniref:ABC transporter ATP-binding protein n=1 Tax=Clostridium sp. TaxID=1506 RepID=UPI00321675DA
MSNILEINNINKAYKNFKIDNVSFNLQRGYIMGFIGENGAGKTTIIKLIMNLVKKDSGEINIFGKDNVKFEKEIKEKIGFVYDQCCYHEHLSLDENAKMISKFYKKWDFEVFHSYLNKFSLNKAQKLKDLSKGMKMKFSLCLALSHNAELIIMDEPTAGLDPIVRAEVLDVLQSIIEDEQVGVLISTHITSDLEKIADYITFIREGKIVFSETKDEILESYKIVKGEQSLLTHDIEKYFEGISKNNLGFEGLTRQSDKIKSILGSSIVIERATLEDIMILKK